MEPFRFAASSALLVALAAFSCAAVSNGRAGHRSIPASSSPAEDPADFNAVQAVCTRCHGVGMFIGKPRTWNRWNEVFTRMTDHGARPTDDQVDHIVRYFLANLTYVNVNTSPPDELGPALGVSDAVASEIVERRERRKFKDLADLGSISGVNPAVLEERKSRIEF